MTYRFRTGTLHLSKIIRFPKRTELLIHKLLFQKLILELSVEHKNDVRCHSFHFLDLQEASKAHLVPLFKNMKPLHHLKQENNHYAKGHPIRQQNPL